jgi:hypothetical protein
MDYVKALFLSVKSIKKIKAHWVDKLRPSSTYLIEMYYSNGTISHLTVSTNGTYFKYNKRSYVIDEERKIYNNSTRLYMLRYHENFALPFSTQISSSELKGMIPDEFSHTKSDFNIRTSFNPSVLIDVLKGEYTKGVIKGAEISQYIKRSFLLMIIVLIAVLLHFLVAAYKMGWMG